METTDIVKIVAGASGWIAAAITFWKHRADFKEKEANILREARRELDSNPHYQMVLEALEAERLMKPLPHQLTAHDLRRLPSFLEDVASHWEFKTVSTAGAYDVVGAEVLLCDESKLMWEGENPPRAEIYWRLFNLFARAMKAERSRRT